VYIKEKIQSKNYDSQKVDYSDVAKLISDGNIVALFQGKSESGERSLGNRSLLFDPRIKNGKTIVNKIKRRENFRPFAATVLLEYVDDWFDLGTLKESPTMSFAVNAHLKTIELIPSVIHADNTCRIQTITEDQNYHFYKLIKTFYDLTSIPMILNTSFNLAEKPIVENFEQSIFALKQSLIEYLYLPEIETLI
jgi:carbamoyltransferase